MFLAEEPLIADVLGLKHRGNVGAYVGLLRNHSLRIELDINQLVQRHVSVLAKTGGGKSYLLGVLIEELLRHKVTCLIIDPHGEYGSLRRPAEANGVHARFHVEAQGFAPQIQEYLPGRLAQPDGEAAHVQPPATSSPATSWSSWGSRTSSRSSPRSRRSSRSVAALHPDYTVKDLVRAAEGGEGAVAETLHERLEYLEQTKLLGPQGTSARRACRRKARRH